jgi:sugar-specific transcriptional regulator TrmB
MIMTNTSTQFRQFINNESLEQIGLEKNESKIYLALIELGETTIIPLSKKAELPRTTCYSVIERMAKKGLLSQIVKGSHTFLSAASPEKIYEFAIFREAEAKSQRQLAERIIPQLVNFSREVTGKPKIQYFSGKQGIRAIFEDLLTSGEVKTYYLGSTKKCLEIAGENFMKNWVKRRVRAGIFSYGVRIETEEELRNTFRSSKKNMRQIKFAPPNAAFPVYTAIYGNKVAFITSHKEGFGLIIDSEDFSMTFKSIFTIIWNASKLYKEKNY